jgi:dTDP-4-dehydrorhamnose reductase
VTQDRDAFRQKCGETLQQLGEVEYENARLRQFLKESEQRHKSVEHDRECLVSQLEDTRGRLEISSALCDKLSQQLRDAETDLRQLLAKDTDADEQSISTAPQSPCVEPNGWGSTFGDSKCSLAEMYDLEPPLGRTPLVHSVSSTGERLRVLITGATGLLGRQLVKAVEETTTWDVRGFGLRRARPPATLACDLAVCGAAAQQIEAFRPHVVIHLATERRQEAMRKEPARAEFLNVDVVGVIAAACEQRGAWLLFLSTDRVFDGTAAPYAEDAATSPTSEYAKQKVRAEELVLTASPRAAILRVPLLYGPVHFVGESSVTSIFADLRSGVWRADDRRTRYPTWAGDVAGILCSMVRLHCEGTSLAGIFHWQGGEGVSRREMQLLITEVAGLYAAQSGEAPEWAASVPPGAASGASAGLPSESCSRLACMRLEALVDGTRFRTPFREGLHICIPPLLHQNRATFGGGERRGAPGSFG